MKTCKDCKKEIDNKATKCPFCQSDQRNWFKRHKILTIIIIIVGFFILLGVAGSSDEVTTNEAETAKTEGEQVFNVNQDVASGDVTWKVTAVKDRGSSLLAKDSRFSTISKTKTTAGKYIEVAFTVENTGKDLASITTPSLVDSQGREFTSSADVSEWIPEGKDLFLLSNLQPNLAKEFVVIFEVPQDATELKAKVGVLRPELIELGL